MRLRHASAMISTVLLCIGFQSTPAQAIRQPIGRTEIQDDIPSDDEQALFANATGLYHHGEFNQAASQLRDFVKQHPRSAIFDLSLLWLGRSYLGMSQFEEAGQVCQKLRSIKKSPFGEILDEEIKSAKRNLSDKTNHAPKARQVITVAGPATISTLSTRKENSTLRGEDVSVISVAKRSDAKNEPGLPTGTSGTRSPVISDSIDGAFPGTVAAPKTIEAHLVDMRLDAVQPSNSGSVGKTIQIPVTIRNIGNQADRFRLESDVPVDYKPVFRLARGSTLPDLPILETGQVPSGSSIDAVLEITLPDRSANTTLEYNIRAFSLTDLSVRHNKLGSMRIVGAALTALPSLAGITALRGKNFEQTIAFQNTGAAVAKDIEIEFSINHVFEFVTATPRANFDQERQRLVWSVGDVGPGETRRITLTLKPRQNEVAQKISSGEGILRSSSVAGSVKLSGAAVTIPAVPIVLTESVVLAGSARPGESTWLPFVVRNGGNTADSFNLSVFGGRTGSSKIFADLNRDGIHQENEPEVGRTDSLDALTGTSAVLVKVDNPVEISAQQAITYRLHASSVLDPKVQSDAESRITVTMPIVRVLMEPIERNADDSVHYRLVLRNDGSSVAKNIVLTQFVTGGFEVIGTIPSLTGSDASSAKIVWLVPELAPGEAISLRVTCKASTGTIAGALPSESHGLSYQDDHGRNYQ